MCWNYPLLGMFSMHELEMKVVALCGGNLATSGKSQTITLITTSDGSESPVAWGVDEA